MRSPLLILLAIVICLFPVTSSYAGVKKSQLVFKLKKSYQGLSYCAKVGSIWVAASKYSKGKVTLPARDNKKANANCATKAPRMLKASLSYVIQKSNATTTRRDAQSKATIREVTMIDPLTREPYVVYFLADIPVSTIIGLPNNYSFIIPMSQSVTVAGETCRVVLLTPTGAIRCVPESLVGLVLEGGETSELKAGRSFQLDAAGNTYFWALEYVSGLGLPQLIKMTPSGEFSAIYRATVEEGTPAFQIKPDGSMVFVSISGLQAPSLKYVSALQVKSTLIEDTRTIAGLGVGYLLRYPGDSVLAGLSNFLAGTTRSDPSNAKIIKINSEVTSYENIISAAANLPTVATTESICTGAGTELISFCDYAGTRIASSHTSSEAAYLIMAQSPLEGNARRILMRINDTGIQTITLSLIEEPREISGFGDHLVVAGKSSSGGGRIVHYNVNTREEALLIDGISVIDNPGNLFYSFRTQSILGAGTRDVDSREVLLQIPISSSGPSSGATTRIPSALDGMSFSY